MYLFHISNVEEDMFYLVVKDKNRPENRKGVLSSIATVYDPLGFASPLLLPGREVNQPGREVNRQEVM